MDDEEPYEPFWPVVHDEKKREQPQSSASSSVLFVLVMAGAVIIGTSGNQLQTAVTSASRETGVRSFTGFLRSQGAVKYTEDFEGNLSDWGGTPEDGWVRDNGFIRPGRLRIWTPTKKLSDYEFEFAGQIEKKALSWAFRAVDEKNFYGTKIVIAKPGPLPRAELVRYAMLDGTVRMRNTLPLPATVRPDTTYRLKINVRRDQFTTYLNGQVIDTWADQTLRTGGVGLFSDPGESSLVSWASLSSRDGALGQFMSYFGFWTPVRPPDLLMPAMMPLR
ncbi:MAG TPA: hypothetical protein VFL57_02905 [Bryobacteraceae bacterium]|nr:hypothetical protein [Bryobacteraceae bacterium]